MTYFEHFRFNYNLVRVVIGYKAIQLCAHLKGINLILLSQHQLVQSCFGQSVQVALDYIAAIQLN